MNLDFESYEKYEYKNIKETLWDTYIDSYF